MPKPLQEVFDRFQFYLSEYKDLIGKHPYSSVSKRNILMDPRISERFTVLQTYKDHPFHYIECLINDLDNFYQDFNEEDKISLLHSLLDDLDIYMSDPNYINFTHTDVLNNRLFVRAPKFWKKNTRKPVSSYSKSFESFGLFDQDCEAIILDLDEQLDSFSSNKIEICLFPLSAEYLTQYKFTQILNPERKTYGFVSDRINFEKKFEELEKVIQIIAEQNIQIACFPELVICDESLEYLNKRITDLKKEFFILIAGSFHRITGEGLYKNTIPILVYQNSNLGKYSYSKLEPVFFEIQKLNQADLRLYFPDIDEFIKCNDTIRFLEEDIEPDHAILVFKTLKFGNFGFVICKDILPDESRVMKFYKKLIDHLFVISMNNSGKADFKEKANHLFNEFKISTFYVNALSFDLTRTSPTFLKIPDGKYVELSEIEPTPFLTYSLTGKTR